MEIGQVIRTLRKQRGLTQAELAGTEVPRTYISMLERGRLKPSDRRLRFIAQRLGIPPQALRSTRGEATGVEAERLLLMAHDLLRKGLVGEASSRAARAARLADASGDRRLAALAYEVQGDCAVRAGRHDRAIAHYSQALELRWATEDAVAAARVYKSIGNCHYWREEPEHAANSFVLGLRALGSRSSQPVLRSQLLCNLGNSSCMLGKPVQARACYRAALRVADEEGDRVRALHALIGLGHVLVDLREADEAELVLRRARHLAGIWNPDLKARVLHNLSRLSGLRGNWRTAVSQLRAAANAYLAAENAAVAAEAWYDAGYTLAAHHRWTEALRAYREAVRIGGLRVRWLARKLIAGIARLERRLRAARQNGAARG